MPEVSVVIPCYNSAAFLESCLKSVMAQTLSDIEILVVDDGSTDDSLAVGQRIAANDRRITVLAQAHSGPGDARNRGIDAARATCITFVDSDDELQADACEALLRGIAPDVDVVIGRTRGRSWNVPRGGRDRFVAALYTGRLSMSAYAKLYRRAFLVEHQIRFPSHVFIEDRHFQLQCLVGGARLAWVDHVVYDRRTRPDSTMHRVGLKHVSDVTEVYQLDAALLERRGCLEDFGRHVAWATLVVDVYLARALATGDVALRDALEREVQWHEKLFQSLPGPRWRTRRLMAAAARLRRAVGRDGSLRFVSAELAVLKALL